MDGELQMQRYLTTVPGSVPRPLSAGVGMKTVVDVVRIESDGVRIRFRRRFEQLSSDDIILTNLTGR